MSRTKDRVIRGISIVKLSRANSSVNGNPAWWVTFDNGMRLRTMTDASVSYGLSDPEFRGVLLHVSVSRSDRITDVRVCDCGACTREREIEEASRTS